LCPHSRLRDPPPADLTLADVLPLAREYELAVLHTSAPSFGHDVKVAEALKGENPALRIGLVGAHVAVQREAALAASPALDFVCGNEFDFTIREIAEGCALASVAGLSYRDAGGELRRTPERGTLEDMDALPWVVDVYARDLEIERYAIGYLEHPYVSLYTGRGCRSKCTFCLWPQTVGGQRYRTRSVGNVVAEIAHATKLFPRVKEYFFDDDTFTDDLPRAEAIARGLGRLGVTWSCNAKPDVPMASLRILRDNGLRLLLVGYESGSQAILNNVRKGTRLDRAREFTRVARALGIKIHGTFILGLPGETRETIEATIRFAQQIDPHTLQVSLAAPYPGTALYREALERGEPVARRRQPVDHRWQRRAETCGRAGRALRVVQVDDRARMCAAQHVRDLGLRRRRSQPFGLDRPEHAALAVAPERAEHRRVHHAPRRAEERGRRSREIAQQVLRARDLALRAARA